MYVHFKDDLIDPARIKIPLEIIDPVRARRRCFGDGPIVCESFRLRFVSFFVERKR